MTGDRWWVFALVILTLSLALCAWIWWMDRDLKKKRPRM